MKKIERMKNIITILYLSFLSTTLIAQICTTTDAKQSVVVFDLDSTVTYRDDSEFSLSETTKVYFLLGNLQYQPSTGTYRIADHQYDFVGGKFSGTADAAHGLPTGTYGTVWETIDGVRKRCTNDSISNATYRGWIDLFTFGTGDLHGEDIATGETYRTPTEDEYRYLFEGRENARSLRGRARIVLPGVGAAPDTLVNGVILMPDNWDPAVLPNNNFISDSLGCWYYYDNVFTLSEWYILESYGAIFLPAAGTSDGQTKYNRSGYYWTGTSNKDKGVSLEFGGFYYANSGVEVNAEPSFQRGANKSHHRAIRLCKEVKVTQ